MLLLGEFVASKKGFVRNAMFSTPGRFRHSTSKTFFDDTCPLFTPDFMSYFIHEIILPLKTLDFLSNYLMKTSKNRGTYYLPFTVHETFSKEEK